MSKQKVLYRPVKQTFEESMAHVRAFKTFNEMLDYLQKNFGRFGLDEIKLEYMRNGDSRNGWTNSADFYILDKDNQLKHLGTFTTEWDYTDMNTCMRKLDARYNCFTKWQTTIIGLSEETFNLNRKNTPAEDIGPYMCNRCFTLYKAIKYADLEPCCGDLCFIERFIADDVVTLNKKGYTTDMSCSGHLVPFHSDYPWISFEYYTLENNGIELMEFFDSAEEFEKVHFAAGFHDCIIHSLDDYMKYRLSMKGYPTIFIIGDPFNDEEERKAVYKDLHKWAESLRDYSHD